LPFAGGRLDLDDVGAEVAEALGGERAGHRDRAVDDSVAVENAAGGGSDHCVPCCGGQTGVSTPPAADERSSASMSSTLRAATVTSELFSVEAPVMSSMKRTGGTRHSYSPSSGAMSSDSRRPS